LSGVRIDPNGQKWGACRPAARGRRTSVANWQECGQPPSTLRGATLAMRSWSIITARWLTAA